MFYGCMHVGVPVLSHVPVYIVLQDIYNDMFCGVRACLLSCTRVVKVPNDDNYD